MFDFGAKKRIAELEEQIARLSAERDGLLEQTQSLSAELERLRPYAGIADADAAIRKHKADYARQHNEAVARFKTQLAAAKQRILDEYGKAKAAHESATLEAAKLTDKARLEAGKIVSAAKEETFAEYQKLGEERESVKQEREGILDAARLEAATIIMEARTEAETIILEARTVTQDKEQLAAAKKEIKEKQQAEKAAERERIKAEKTAEKERLKAEKAAERERIKAEKIAAKEAERLERERKLAMRPKTIRFDYCDAEGETTTRTVDILYCYAGSEGYYLKGYCHMRNDERTFRLDRIQGDIINQTTGEVMTKWEFVRRYDN